METTVLIMCQGEQRRLGRLGYPKQLVDVDGVPNLHRTVGLILEMGRMVDARICVVGRNSDRLALALSGLCDERELPDPGHCILDGIAATADLWRGRVIILLGDVVFSRAALAAIVDDERPLFFAGKKIADTTGENTTGELFALSFAAEEHARIAILLGSVPCRTRDHGREPMRYATGQQSGHLRYLLWHLQRGARNPWPAYFLAIDDWTDDIDYPSDIERLPDFNHWAKAELS